jgi:hypothetical protein
VDIEQGGRPSHPAIALTAGITLTLLVACAGVASSPDRATIRTDASATPTSVSAGGLAPPPGVSTAVLCLTPFEGPLTGRSDCAVTPAGAVPSSLRDELGGAPSVPRRDTGPVCAVAAASFTLLWLDDDVLADRVRIPDATCLTARRSSDENVSFVVSEALLDELAAFHAAEARTGGAFDGLADADPVAALCARRYPQQLAEMPLALDVVVLGVSPTDPAATPESPGVPFTDVDVLAVEAGPRTVLRSLGGPPDDVNAVGERLLVANTSPFLSACGFTQPYSRDTAELWREAFS